MHLTAEDIARIIAARPDFDPATFDIEAFVDALDDPTVNDLAGRIIEAEEANRFNLFERLFPDDGPLRRALYPKHVEFFGAGLTHQQRLFMAGNRVGKTMAGGYETTCHLTGRYPSWWPGRKFRRPGPWWVAGDTNETTRDILQLTLLGKVCWVGNVKTFDGSGIIPRETIGKVTWKQGVPDLADNVFIKHVTGGWAQLGFKSYDQGRRVFQGTAKQGIWLDEECPMDVYNESMIRLATTRGLMMLTFTPLLGLSDVVLSFLPKEWQPEAA